MKKLFVSLWLMMAFVLAGAQDVSYKANIKAARNGDAYAQFLIGKCFHKGDGVDQNYDLAAFWFRKSADQGNAFSQFALGLYYGQGWGVTQDYKQEVYWFSKAAEQDNPDAQYMLGLCYASGEGVTQDNAQAAYWLHKAAEQGYEDAIKFLAENGNDFQPNTNSVSTVEELTNRANQLYKEEKYAEAFQYFLKAAEKNDAYSMAYIGYMYYFGKGVTKDLTQSVSWYRKAANLGNAYGQFALGGFYEEGEGVTQDNAQAAYWYRKAADQGLEDAQKALAALENNQNGGGSDFDKDLAAAKRGDASAQTNVGYYYYEGEGVTQDYKQAAFWFRKAADQGNAEAQYYLGLCYYNGQGVPEDDALAVSWFLKAANQGDADAQCYLGICYEDGCGVSQDKTQAANWYRKAAEQGNEYSQYKLGTFYYNGIGVKQNYAQAVNWFRKAAEQGHVDAQTYLGYCYSAGEGVTKDMTQAIQWYRKAADQGNVYAQFNLGLFYYNGDGIAKDFKQAAFLFQKAADQGYGSAQNSLGVCYYMGQGVPKDAKQAVKWYQKAVDHGIVEAMRNLGICYEYGNGVTQDVKKAIELYKRAAAGGNEKAKKHLAELEEANKKDQPNPQPKLKSTTVITFLDNASTANSKEYQLKVGIKSNSKIEDVSVTVNGSQSRGINTVKSDGNDLTIDRKLILSEGVNKIVVGVRNAEGVTTEEKTITCKPTSSAGASGNRRIALVMGNSNYLDINNRLKNPANDATDLAEKLQSLGFTVIRSIDQTKKGMKDAMREFGEKAKSYDVALFFYAGHGIQVNGCNYLLPTDAELPSADEVEDGCINVNFVLNKMEAAHCPMKIVILDACRDNPFARSWSRGLSDHGLNITSPPKGTFIAYATSEGDVASDGKGRNSPYTTALLEQLDVPNQSLEKLFKNVLEKVTDITGEKQNPWTSGSFRGDFYFNQK